MVSRHAYYQFRNRRPTILAIITTNARCRPGGQATTITERARSDYSMLGPDIDMTAVQAWSKTSFPWLQSATTLLFLFSFPRTRQIRARRLGHAHTHGRTHTHTHTHLGY